MKALIYCRVSSDRQVKDGHGLGSQEKRCRDYANNENHNVVKVFPDEGISGSLFERPAMRDMITYLDEHANEKFVIIFDDLSRFAREVKTHIQLKTELVSRGAILKCLNFNFEDSDESEFAELILAASNQYQRKSNKRQVIQKQKARLDKGYWSFATPVGMVNKKDPIHGKILVPQEPHASIFKVAIEKYADGILHTPQEVRMFLHEEYKKLDLLNRPSLSTTQKILRNPLFCGYIEYTKWGVPFKKAQHEGFISFDTYKAVQERLQGRAKPWRRRDFSEDFPLRPFVLCSPCMTPLSASWNKGRSERYPNYFCRNNECKYKWKVTRKYILESKFEELLGDVRPLDDHIDLTRDILQEQWGIRLDQHAEHRSGNMTDIKEAENSIRSYLSLVSKATDPELKNVYEQELATSIRKKKLAEEQLSKQNYTPEQFGTALEKVLNTLKEPMLMWKSDNYNDRRMVLFMYFEDKLRYDYKEGFGTANLAYPVKLINDLGQAKNGNVEMSGSEPESETY